MLNRRTFNAMLAGAAVAPGLASNVAWSQAMKKTVYYGSVGPELTLYDMDIEAGTITKRSTASTPGANIQYVWPHPSKKYLYVVSSDGGPGEIRGTRHIAQAFRIDPASGALSAHGEPAALPSRPIHSSVDAAGEYLLTAYNIPSNITVHRIKGDGVIGDLVAQPDKPDAGIFAHQILTTPGNQSVILVARGNHGTSSKPEDPGALKVYGFKNGVLSNLASVAPGNGLGFGPRHIDFHPTQPWVFVSVERQSQLYVYKLEPNGSLSKDPLFVKSSLADRGNAPPPQAAGAIHVHPNGRFVYLTNRNSGTVDFEGQKVSKGGENNIAVFSIDPATGEPTLIQNADAKTIHLRTFAVDPSGKLLIAASIRPMLVRDGGKVSTLTAGQIVYRIGNDGRLEFVRKYDVDTGEFLQFWSGIVALS
jgi:6-phosphogluconolactonase (cycloisomerase 2 family)